MSFDLKGNYERGQGRIISVRNGTLSNFNREDARVAQNLEDKLSSAQVDICVANVVEILCTSKEFCACTKVWLGFGLPVAAFLYLRIQEPKVQLIQ